MEAPAFSQAPADAMTSAPVSIATQNESISKPLFVVPSGYTAVRIPDHTEITKLADVHPCDWVDGWAAIETVVLNSVHALRDFLYIMEDLETRKKVLDLISYFIFFASTNSAKFIDIDDLRFSEDLTRHAMHVASFLRNAGSKEKRLRCFRIYKAILAEAMFSRADPAMSSFLAQSTVFLLNVLFALCFSSLNA